MQTQLPTIIVGYYVVFRSRQNFFEMPTRPNETWHVSLSQTSLALSLGSMASNQAHLSPGLGFVHTAHDFDLDLHSLSSPLPVTILSFSKLRVIVNSSKKLALTKYFRSS